MRAKEKIRYVVNGVIRRKSFWYKNVLFADCEKFWKQRTFNLDVVNLGSSSGKYAFDYSGTGLKGANWAMAPQSLVADLAILKTYCSFLKPQGGVVLVPLCPFSCLGGSDMYFPNKYYTILKMSSMPHSAYREQQEAYSMRFNPVRYYPALESLRDLLYLFHLPKNRIPLSDFQKDAEHWMQGWMHEFSIMDFKHPLIMKNKDAYKDSARLLAEIIRFCLDRDFRPIIVVPPVTKHLSALFTEEMRETFIYSFVRQGNRQGAGFFDYFDDPAFSAKPRLFRNSLFLNEEGAKLFTGQVLKDAGVL